MTGTFLAVSVVLALVLLPMVAELRHSRANERALRARGALEPPGDVYRVMRVAYPCSFGFMAVEGFLRGPAAPWLWLGLGVFVLAKALKFWAIRSLGPRWSFRVLVLPGAPLVTHGPYRFLRHPNYAAVLGELAGAALMLAAPWTGTLALAVFGTLVARRIRVEESAHGRPHARRSDRHQP